MWQALAPSNQALRVELGRLVGMLPENFENPADPRRICPPVVLRDTQEICAFPEGIKPGTTSCPRHQFGQQFVLPAEPVGSVVHGRMFPAGCGTCPVPSKIFFFRHGKPGISRKLFSFGRPWKAGNMRV